MRSVYTKVMLAICDFHQNGSACYSHFLDKSALLAIPEIDKKERKEMAKKDFSSTAEQNLKAMFGIAPKGEEEQKKEKAAEPTPGTDKKEPVDDLNKEPVKKNPGAAEQEGQIIPPGYVLKKEGKSIRATILFRPSTLQRLRERAAEEGTSFNELCNQYLEKCLNERR